MRTATCFLCALTALLPRAMAAQLDTAWVDRALAAPVQSGSVLRADSEPGRLRLPSEGTALALSAGTTLGLVGLGAIDLHGSANAQSSLLVFTGLYLGPAVGYWYAGSSRWKSGLVIRSVGLGIGAAGFALWSSSDLLGSNSVKGDSGALLMFAGAIVIAADAIHDCAKVASVVREENEARSRVQVLPMIAPDGRHVGLGARITF